MLMLMLTVVFGVTVDANVNSSFFGGSADANVNSDFQCQRRC